MKKKMMKLNLSRETLRHLSAQDVSQAAGGFRTFIKGSCVDCSDNSCLTCNSCDTCPGLTCATCPV